MSQLPSPRAAAPEMPETKDLSLFFLKNKNRRLVSPGHTTLEPIFHLRTLLILNKVIDVK